MKITNLTGAEQFAELNRLIAEDDRDYWLDRQTFSSYEGHAHYVRSQGIIFEFMDEPENQSFRALSLEPANTYDPDCTSDEETLFHSDWNGYARRRGLDPAIGEAIRTTHYHEYGEVISVKHTSPYIQEIRTLVLKEHEAFMEPSAYVTAYAGDFPAWIEGLKYFPHRTQFVYLRALFAQNRNLKGTFSKEEMQLLRDTISWLLPTPCHHERIR